MKTRYLTQLSLAYTLIQRDINKTYQALQFRHSGDLIVSQLQCSYVVVAGQVLEIRAFD